MSTRQSLRSIVVVEVVGEEVVVEAVEEDAAVLVTAVAEAEITISSYYRRKHSGEALEFYYYCFSLCGTFGFSVPSLGFEVLQYICGWRTVGALHRSLNSSHKIYEG